MGKRGVRAKLQLPLTGGYASAESKDSRDASQPPGPRKPADARAPATRKMWLGTHLGDCLANNLQSISPKPSIIPQGMITPPSRRACRSRLQLSGSWVLGDPSAPARTSAPPSHLIGPGGLGGPGGGAGRNERPQQPRAAARVPGGESPRARRGQYARPSLALSALIAAAPLTPPEGEPRISRSRAGLGPARAGAARGGGCSRPAPARAAG